MNEIAEAYKAVAARMVNAPRPRAAAFDRIGVCFCGKHLSHYCRDCGYAPWWPIPPQPADDGFVTVSARVPRDIAESVEATFRKHDHEVTVTDESWYEYLSIQRIRATRMPT